MADGYRQPQYPSGNSFMDSLASLTQYNQANRMYDDTRRDKYQSDSEKYMQKTTDVNIGMLSQRALINQQEEVDRYKNDYLSTIKEIAANAAQAKEEQNQALITALQSHIKRIDNTPKVNQNNTKTVAIDASNSYLNPSKAQPYNPFSSFARELMNVNRDRVSQEQYSQSTVVPEWGEYIAPDKPRAVGEGILTHYLKTAELPDMSWESITASNPISTQSDRKIPTWGYERRGR